jgi:hypothetical protein
VAVLAVFGMMLGVMLVTTPLYEIDTNSYIRGGFSWSIFHNPLLNLLYAIAGKVWSNAGFLVACQLAIYAVCASALAFTLFPAGKWRWAALAVAVLEPVSLFYHLSMIAESVFTSFLLLSLAFLIRWMRRGKLADAFLFGAAFGLAFLSKLAAMPLVPLFGLLLFPAGLAATRVPLLRRGLALLVAALPFLACYQGVKWGQAIINDGGLYTVEGRVRWDFSAALYDPAACDDAYFKELMHPWILKDGKVLADRELRRELGYLGYKQCVLRQGDNNAAILFCDSVFGRVATPIMREHFWQAEQVFVQENLHSIHHLNYLDYRYTPGLPFYHPEQEYDYLDSLMSRHYGLDLGERLHRIPVLWRSLSFTNVYLPLLWWLTWLILLVSVVRWLRNRQHIELLVLGVAITIPWVFHLVYISYRPRFLAPYLVMVLFLLMVNLRGLLAKKTS